MKKLYRILSRIVVLTVVSLIVAGLSYTVFRGSHNDRISRCFNLPTNEKKYCWDSAIRWITQYEGIDRALDAIQTWSTTRSDIKKNCHDLLHSIGQEAYALYKKGGRIALTEQSQVCAHGFYHGVMESFIGKGEDIRLAGSFCESVTADQKEKQSALLGSCYHGIGHGAILLHHNNAGTEPWNLVNTGIYLCQQATDTPMKLQNCVNGVIDGLASAFVTGEYSLSESMKVDPLQICRKLNDVHKAACYTGLDWLILHIADKDLWKAAKFIEAIAEDTYAIASIHELASLSVFILKDPTSVKHTVFVCRTLQARLRLPCIQGLSAGLFWYVGLPDHEYEPMLALCQNKILLPVESDACFGELIVVAHIRYSKERVKQICTSLLTHYQTQCAREN